MPITEMFNSFLTRFGTKNRGTQSRSGEAEPPKKKFLAPRGESKEPVETPGEGENWWKPFAELPADEPAADVANDDISSLLLENETLDRSSLIELPEHIMRIVQLSNDPEFDYDEIEYLISHSPVMAGEFLKVANSSLYSRGVKIGSLRIALPRLGSKTIRALIYFNAALINLSPRPNVRRPATQIVQHSHSVANIAAHLAQQLMPDQESAFLAGLLHDIGKLVILRKLSDIHSLTEEVSQERHAAALSELHERVGGQVGKSWRLGPEIKGAIRHHHSVEAIPDDPENAPVKTLAALVQLADVAARMLGHGTTVGQTDFFALPAAGVLGIEDDRKAAAYLKEIPALLGGA